MAIRAKLTDAALATLTATAPPPSNRPATRSRGKGFVPSPQQADFLTWVSEGTGSCVLEAVAGAGKTTTLIQALLRMEGKVFFGAYNKKIATEIKTKAAENRADRPGVFLGTMHGSGYSDWRRVAPEVRVDERKVADIIKDMGRADPTILGHAAFIQKMVSFGKQFLMGVKRPVTAFGVWRNLAAHFGVDELVPEGEEQRAYELMVEVFEKSAAMCKVVIDFDDMIYAPLRFNARLFQNDWVLIDECQDINPARRELARRMLKPGGRLIAVGDSRQAIYGFTGAGADSIERIVEEFKCTKLPLTVTYRCPQKVVAYAHQWVKHIQSHPTAPEGLVRPVNMAGEPIVCPTCKGDISKPCLTCNGVRAIDDNRPWFMRDTPRKDDAILCRYTQPLILTAFSMIREGIACKVEGRDIGKGLVGLAQRWKISSLTRLEEKLSEYLERETAKARVAENETKAEALKDQVETLRVFIKRCQTIGVTTIAGLVSEIEKLFADDNAGSVTLSTGHKAKGREWDRVYWIETAIRQRNLKDWEMVQEMNIKYVICTRAKAELVLIPEAIAT